MTDINRTAIDLSDGAHKELLQPPAALLTTGDPLGPSFLTSTGDSCQVRPLRLKVVIGIQRDDESRHVSESLENLGCRVLPVGDLKKAIRLIQEWRPDLVIAEEGFGPKEPDGGIRLAEFCLWMEDRVNGWPGTRALILVPIPDWERVRQAQRTGAHIIVKGNNFDAVIHYVQTIAESLATDRILGPALIGIHRYIGEHPDPDCGRCEWIGAEISYGSSQRELRNLTPVRTVLLNLLLFRHRAQSPREIENTCRVSSFVRKILGKRLLRESAVKMEVTRLRRHFDDALEALGVPYNGRHFLPAPEHSANSYYLFGNRRLIHLPALIEPMVQSTGQKVEANIFRSRAFLVD